MKKYWHLEAKDDNEENKEGPFMMAGSPDDSKVSSEYNSIYFYSGVTRQDNMNLNKLILNTGQKMKSIELCYKLPEPPKVYLHINSYGGSVFAGFGTVDYIRSCSVPVVSTIDGCAASAATIMSVVASERYIQEHAFMLIHQLSSGMWGKFEAMKDDMKNNEMLMKKIIKIYEEHTKIPKSKIAQILQRDLWWDARTCLKYGLVDDIVTNG
jgi:ATP-dependent protease ClpP protease subunit